MFGEKAVEEGKTIFIPNAIDCSTFDYDLSARERIRKELGIEGNYVIGHVGSFRYAKNHEYLLRVFAALRDIADTKSSQGNNQKAYVLLLLGEGSGMEAMKELAKELGIDKQVYFLGNRSNVSDYYQAMDYFVYPSRFEGLPGAVVEAQTCGLKCVMSDSICEEVVATDLVETRSIQEEPSAWAAAIMAAQEYERKGYVKEMREAGFDVEEQAEKMMRFYERGKWE